MGIPKQAKLNFGTDKATGRPTSYPLISVENVFVFPGIPELLQKAFHNLGAQLFGSGQIFLQGRQPARMDPTGYFFPDPTLALAVPRTFLVLFFLSFFCFLLTLASH